MILKRQELKRLLNKLKVPRTGQAYVLGVYDKNTPNRVPNGNFLSVCETIASRKMMWTKNSESRSSELPFLMWCEFSSDVLAYFCQPEPIKITYINKHGNKTSHTVCLDYLVITFNEIFLVECKKVSDLENLVRMDGDKYRKEGNSYRYSAAENTLTEMGLGCKVSTDRCFTPIFTRNCIYLFNFIDDLRKDFADNGAEIASCISKLGNRLRLSELSGTFGQLSVLRAMFNRQLFVDFYGELLCQPHLTWVYANKSYHDATLRLKKERNLVAVNSTSQLVGEKTLWWENTPIEILDVVMFPEPSVKLRHPYQGLIRLNTSELSELYSKQELYVEIAATESESNPQNILCSKKAHQIEAAKQRVSALKNNGKNINVSERTLYRWKAKAKSGNDAFLALIPGTDKRGNRLPKISSQAVELMQPYFEQLLRPAPPSILSVFGDYKEACEKEGLSVCTYKSFTKRFRKIDKYYRVLKTKGLKAAYALGPQPREIDLDWDLPYHGDFIFEIAHIDHTPIEMKLISALTGEVLEGTLNFSVMQDGHSRDILAIYLSFEKPSYRCTMMLLRECYRRFGRLPLFIAVDHGPDFESDYFDSTIADLGIHKRRRPKGACRHGSPVERVFGTTESELIHLLLGNKQLEKLGRGLSPTHKPEKFAVWTPDQFDTLIKEYAYLVYRKKHRRGISETPEMRWNRSAEKFDELPGTKVKSEISFYISALPDVDRGGSRVINNNQIEFRGSNYLLSKRVAAYDGKRRRVRVKYNPYDISHIWARVAGRWVKLTTNDVLVRECRDRGIQLAHMEVFSRRLRTARKSKSGVRSSAELHFKSRLREQHAFNIQQSSIGVVESSQESEHQPLFKIDIDSLEILPENA